MKKQAFSGSRIRKETGIKGEGGNVSQMQAAADATLPGSEDLYRKLIENLSEVVFTVDLKGCFTYISPAIERFSGFRSEDVIGQLFEVYIHPDDIAFVRSAFQEALSGIDNMSAEFRVLNKAGEIWYAHVSIRLLMQGGNLTGLVGTLVDITQRKNIESELRTSEQEKRAILNAIPDIMFHLDRRGVFLDYKAENNKGLLVSPDHFLGKRLQDVLPEWLALLTNQHLQAALAEKKPQIYKYSLSLEGHTRYFEARMVPFQEDHVLTIVRDVTEQVWAEQEMLEAEQKYRALVEQIPAIVYTDSAEEMGKTHYVSPQVLTILGFDPVEYSKDNTLWMSAIHPDDRERVLADYTRTYQSGQPFLCEYRIYSKSGKMLWIQDHAVLIRDLADRPLLWQGIMLDITERKQAEDALRESEHKFRNVIEQAIEGIVVVDEQGMVIEFNQAIAEITGLDRNKVLGLPFWELQIKISDADRSGTFKKAILDALRTGESPYFNNPVEVNIHQPDGDVRCVEQIAFGIKTREGYRISCMFRDITARKKSDTDLRASEASYRGLFDSVSEAVYIQDQDGHFLDVNQGAVNMYGYPREYLIGKTPADVSAPGRNDLEKLGTMVARAFEGEPQQFEFWGIRKNGEVFPKEVRLYKGTYFGKDILFALAHDITERKRNENALQRRDAILEAVGFASEQFLKSPDWRQSIDAVLGRLGIAADASRTYIFKNFYDFSGDLLFGQLYEWSAQGIAPQLTNEELQHISYRKNSFLRWRKRLEKNTIIAGNVSTFPESERAILVPQEIVSILVMPIFVGTEWWGFIGFDECRAVREWHPVEIDALKTAASLIGAAIQKMESETARQRQLQELEVLHAVSLACMKSAITDELIENVTRIVIDAFHLDSFGVMLYDQEKKVLNVHPSYHGDYKKVAMEQIQLGEGVTGHVAETHHPYRVDDIRNETRYLTIDPDVRSELCIPILAGKQLIGVLNAESHHLNFFTADTERLLTTISVTMATALEKLSLFEAEYTHRQEAEKLRDASTALTSSLELQPLLDSILESLVKIVPYDSASIVMLEKDRLYIAAACGIPDEVQYKGRFFPVNRKWKTIIRTRQPLILEDALHSTTFEKWAGSEYIRGWMGVPLLVRGQLVGCLCIDSRKPNAFTQEHASLAQTYANHAASAIENARLFSAEREQRHRQDAMVDLMKIAALSLNLETVLENTLVYLFRLIPGRTGTIQLLEGEQLRIAAVIGFDDDQLHSGQLLPLSDYPLNRQIIQEQCAICVEDTWKDERYIHNPKIKGVLSFLGVPLVFKEKAIGMITLDSEKRNGFSQQDVEIAFAVARNISMAIENARLFEAERTRHREAETLRQATAAIASGLDWENAIRLILEQLSKVVSCDSASVQLLRDGYLEIVGGQGWPDSKSVLGLRFPMPGENPNTQVIQTRQPLILGNARSKFIPFLEGIHSHIVSWLGVPMIIHDRVIGMLAVDSAEENRFTEESARLVGAFASQAAIAIENARLYDQALKAAERRAVLHQASEEIARSSQDPQKVYEAVHRAAQRLMPAEAFVISLIDEVRKEICSVYLYDKDGRWPVMYAPLESGLSGEIISSGKGKIIQDILATPLESAIHFGSEEEIRSALAVPMRLGETVIGMLSAQSYRPNAYTEEDQRLLEMLAAHAVVAIENARLFHQTQRRRLEAEALRDATTVLTSSLDGDQVMQHLLDALATVIPYDSATVFLLDGEYLIGKVARGLPFPEKVVGQKFPNTDQLFQEILETRTPLVIQDVQADSRFQYFGETTYLHGWMGVPLIIRDTVIGLLTIDNRDPSAYTRSHAEQALAFANQAATAVEKARLFEEIIHRLTELEVVNRVSTQLRSSLKTDEMLICLLDESMRVLKTDSGSIWLYDPSNGLLKTPLSRGWFMQLGDSPIRPDEGLAGRVFSTGKAIISREFVTDALARESTRTLIPEGWGGSCVPIRSGQETIGVMFIAVELPRELHESDVRLLTTLCEIAGNAIRRADLHEQTERQLQRLASLRTIDMAISTILDLRVTLGILIDHIISQLKVDAVNVLLINSNTQTLYHAASSGFRSDVIKNTQIYLNDSLALQAIRSRSIVFIPRLSESDPFPRQALLTSEGFVTYFGVPLIAKGQVKGILETYHRSPMDPDADWRGFLETLSGQAAIAIDNSVLFEELQQTNLNLSLAYDATIEGWSKALDLRDRETEGHTLRVTEMTLQLADAMGIGSTDLVNIRRGALLHDIGKMGVPDNILHKAGPLTDEEWMVMRQHPEFAYTMLSPINYLRTALDVPYCHHERWDGSGYPRGLSGEQIPLAARLFAVVDVYDALTSTRPYRKGWTIREATEFIRKNSGILFDPRVVDGFLMMLSKQETGR